MKIQFKLKLLAALPLLSTPNSQLSTALAQGTAFTYQGRLDVGGAPANGSYDLTFGVWNTASGPAQVGSTLTNLNVPVSNGPFTVTLDFGNQFSGADRWLEIAVRTNGGGAFETLVPRQPITAAPYALYAPSAGTAATASSVAATHITGTIPLAQLPAALVTNGASGVNLSGTFSGNGSALTNISATAVVAAPPGMVLIPAGPFTMGDNLDGESDATPTLSVTVSAFYMDVNLVSYSQWQSVYFWATNHGYNFVHAGSSKAANHPVQTVDWWDTVKWCNARSQQAGRSPVYYTNAGLTQVYTNGEPTTLYPNWAVSGYRLPTEAEWEKAARGGLSGQRFPWGNVITETLANYVGNTGYSYDLGPNGYNATFATSFPYTSPVGYFTANGYGLYDMAGNVLAWCWDWYGTPYAGGSDPRGPASGSLRVLRGGFWNVDAYTSRCVYRSVGQPSAANNVVGFRCVRGL